MISHRAVVGVKIFFDDSFWILYDVISPNKYDDFLVLQEIIPDKDQQVNEDGSFAQNFCIVDSHNDTWCVVDEKINQLYDKKEFHQKFVSSFYKAVEDKWLEDCGDEDE